MSKVLITRSKLDGLATTIAAKSGATLPLTIAQMDAAVEGISGVDVEALSVTSNGTYTAPSGTAYSPVTVAVPTPSPSLQSKSATPTESAQTVTPDSGYDGLSSVSVGAISSTYVGSGIDQRDSDDLTASGATVTVPAGYYETQASKAVASGTAGTPTATKGTVSNHAVSVTPSVTNTTGYITGGTKTGTAVSVAASELVSGTISITSSGTTDVTNYASASVAAGGATASATKGSVSNHSVSVTPSVTRTAGYVTAGTANGTAVTVSASELVSGSETKTENGTYDVTNLASLTVNVDGGSETYRLDNVVPEQTITTSATYSRAYGGEIQNYTETPQVGSMYLVTFDGTEYVCEGYRGDSTGYVIGEYRLFTSTTVDIYMSVPFACAYYAADGFNLVTRDTNAHTVKVDKLTFIDDGETFTTKTITANGTYNASSDNADGYSSVTVAIPIVTYHTSSSAPTSSQGSDGDLWLVTA